MEKRSFKLGTTSFILPDNIIPNVKKLGPYFDEIELLVFESIPQSVLPSPRDVNTLHDLAREHHLTYNIHLPVDVSLSKGSSKERQAASDILLKVIDLFSFLPVTTFTLHLEPPAHLYPIKGSHPPAMAEWQAQTRHFLTSFVSRLDDPEIISVETLNYPFSLVETFIDDLGLSVCLDAGHMIKYGFDLEKTITDHGHRIPLIHLHGVDFSQKPPKDHISLDRLSGEDLARIYAVLQTYTGVLSLEVFNLENLNRSLSVLSAWFDDIPFNLKFS